VAFEISGLREFRAALRASMAQAPELLEDAHKKLADKAADLARARARGMGGVQARAASAIGGRGDEQAARISVLPSRVDKFGNVAFWGAIRHSGWYANPRYDGSTAQHPPWVGNDWDVAVAGQGPYAINDALAEHLDELLEFYEQMLDELSDGPFPGPLGNVAGNGVISIAF